MEGDTVSVEIPINDEEEITAPKTEVETYVIFCWNLLPRGLIFFFFFLSSVVPVEEPEVKEDKKNGGVVVAEPSGFIFLWQQLLEEMGSAKSTESEENHRITEELDRIRSDVQEFKNNVDHLVSSYTQLRQALGLFGEAMYQLAIKEPDQGLHVPLLDAGLLSRNVSVVMEEKLLSSLVAIRDSIDVQNKAIEDARDTKETYRKARLTYDAAERALQSQQKGGKVSEQTQAERDVAWKRYQDQAIAMKTKVMLLHQHRIRALHKQLESLKSDFANYLAACETKIPAKNHVETQQQGPKTKAMEDVMAKAQNEQ